MAGGTRRGKNRDFLFENINLYGRQPLKMNFVGYDDEHKTSNITIKNLYHNGKKITEIPKENFKQNEFCKNIKII